MQGENVRNFNFILSCLFVNTLFKENECVNVAVHCNCKAEENFHFTESLCTDLAILAMQQA